MRCSWPDSCEVRWTNPSGGVGQVATNWDLEGIPGEGDTTIFDLSGAYTVEASAALVSI